MTGQLISPDKTTLQLLYIVHKSKFGDVQSRCNQVVRHVFSLNKDINERAVQSKQQVNLEIYRQIGVAD